MAPGGGHKRAYAKVDFKRGKLGVPATVERLEYDPNRTAVHRPSRYEDGELSTSRAARLASATTVIPTPARREARQRHALPACRSATIVHNVEMKKGKGGQIARAAGTYVQLVAATRATPS